jgi:hypothetical protein
MSDIRVIDGYFPDWVVEDVGNYLSTDFPFYYNNTPYGDYSKARFWGNTVIRDNEFTSETPWYWFFAYFNECIMKDICKDLPLTHIHRLLVNAQNPGHVSQTHTDFNRPATSIIYHAYGEDGCTTFAKGEKVDFQMGRIIVFDSLMEHDGEPPTNDIRISLGAIAPHSGVQFA